MRSPVRGSNAALVTQDVDSAATVRSPSNRPSKPAHGRDILSKTDRIVITGEARFLGSFVTKMLKARGYIISN
jgi:hypothetical protein